MPRFVAEPLAETKQPDDDEPPPLYDDSDDEESRGWIPRSSRIEVQGCSETIPNITGMDTTKLEDLPERYLQPGSSWVSARAVLTARGVRSPLAINFSKHQLPLSFRP